MTDAISADEAAGASPFAMPTAEQLAARLTDEIAVIEAETRQACAHLSSAAAGERLAIIVQLALRRSAAYAAGYRAHLLTQARQVQRQRGELVRQLQRRARHLLSSPLPGPTASVQAADPLESFRSVWALVEDTMAAEAARTVVRLPIRPSLAVLRDFLAVAVGERRLHERVVAAVHADLDSGAAIAASLDLLLEAIHAAGAGVDLEVTSAPASPRRDGQGCVAAAAGGRPPAHRSSAVSSLEAVGPVVCVPVIVSLAQYCGDGPWVTTHDALTEEERQRRKRASPEGDEDVADRVGFLFNRRGVDLGGGRGGGGASASGGGLSSSVRTAASLYERPPALAADGDSGEVGGPGEADRDTLHAQAQVVAARVTALVDAEWPSTVRETAVEAMILEVLREKTGGQEGKGKAVDVDEPSPTAATATRTDGALVEGLRIVGGADEEEAVAQVEEYLSILRVLYSVELTARVLAVHTAGKLLMDSGDTVCFDGLRCVPLCVEPACALLTPLPDAHATSTAAADLGIREGGGGGAGQALEGRGVPLPPRPASPSDPRAAAGGAGASAASLVPVTVFNLPETENVFYCVAVTVGLALLQDAARARRPTRPPRSSDPAASVTVGNAEEEEEEEEEAYRLRAAGVQPEAARQERRTDAWFAALEAVLVGTPTAHRVAMTGPTPQCDEGARDPPDHPLAPSDLPFPAALRLWHYLWEHVFAVEAAEPAGAPAVPSLLSPMVVPLARARRWLDAQVAATLARNVRVSHLISTVEAEAEVSLVGLRSPLPPLLAAAALRIRDETVRLWQAGRA